MKFVCFLLFTLLVASPAFAIKYSDCGSSATVSDVQVSGCENEDICPLKKETDVTLTIKFTSKTASKSLKTVVYGVVYGVPLPFPVPHPDACSDSGVSCPLTEGQNYVYTNKLHVQGSYPSVSVDVKWTVQDENDQDVVCVKIPAKIE